MHTHFGKDVSSQMLHLYVAGASESPLTPMFKIMYHETCEFEDARMLPDGRLTVFCTNVSAKTDLFWSGWVLPKTKRNFASDVSAENAHFYFADSFRVAVLMSKSFFECLSQNG